jgi:outer membrane lipoprotein-sorting protein
MNKIIRIEIRMRHLLSAFLALYALAAGAAEIPQVVRTCMQQNLPKTTSEQSIELRARDRSGYEQVLEADVFWKRYAEDQARVMMYFREPVDIRGARFLVVQKKPENDMYIYMPALFKVRKVTSRNISNSIMGTDFSYEDFERLQGMLSDLRAEQLPDATLVGRPVYVLMSYPPETSGYVKIATYIDKESCIPLQIEFYESEHELRKLLTVKPSDIQHQDGIYFPQELVLKDLKQKTATRLIVHDVTIGATLNEDLFNPKKMQGAEIPAISSKP